MILLAEVYACKGEPRDLKVDEVFSFLPELLKKIKSYRHEINTIWDILYFGESAFKKLLSESEFVALNNKLDSYGLKFGDPIIGYREYDENSLKNGLFEHGLDVLDKCSTIDFLEGCPAMEFINDTVMKYIKNNVILPVKNVETHAQVIEVEKSADLWINKYKEKVYAKRIKINELSAPKPALEQEKKGAIVRMSRRLGGLKYFHHQPNIKGEKVHKHNPYSAEDDLL